MVLFCIIYQFWYVINHPTLPHIVKTNRGDMRRFRPFSHHASLEIFWTITPSFILISIALPSFEMLYAMDAALSAQATIKVIGHQWYWSYEFYDMDMGSLSFDSNIVFDSDLEFGTHRLLQTDFPLILPVDMPIRFIITSTDVLHSWSIPSFGVKCDAVPGRLNQVMVFIKREGVFYGQCSELCGVSHGFMPIEVIAKIQHPITAITSIQYPTGESNTITQFAKRNKNFC